MRRGKDDVAKTRWRRGKTQTTKEVLLQSVRVQLLVSARFADFGDPCFVPYYTLSAK